MPEEDREWVLKTLAGDTTAYDYLIGKYMERAYRIAFRMTNNHEDAEEITQEAFLKSFKALKSFRADARFYTWFCRILINLCHDHLRKKRFRSRYHFFFKQEHEGPEKKNEIETDYADTHWSSNPYEAVEQAEMKRAIENALSKLPVRQKTIFVLRHFHDLRIREIAKILKISEGTVKAQIFRAVQALRKSLQGVR